jgi:hypothetical protein
LAPAKAKLCFCAASRFFFSPASPPWPSAVQSYKTLYTGNAQAQIEGDRAQEARGPRMDQGRPFRGRDVREKKKRFLVTFCRLAKSYPLAAG